MSVSKAAGLFVVGHRRGVDATPLKTNEMEKKLSGTEFRFSTPTYGRQNAITPVRRRAPLRELPKNVAANQSGSDLRVHFSSRKRSMVDDRNRKSKLLKLGPQSPPPLINLDDSHSSDNHNNEKLTLQIIREPARFHTAYHSIDGKTLVTQLQLGEASFLSKYVLYDCRYPYEYDNGHIMYAQNLYDIEQLETVFYPKSQRIPIFYCEYSQKRGPGMARALREIDRRRNVDDYPNVDYAEIYVLDRGYKQFYQLYKAFCEPQSYVPMDDPEYVHQERLYNTKRKDTKRTRAEIKRTRILSHASSQPQFF
ncbi:Protein-tyrosine-phosphatase [Aphelenchoides besseyi]|nr:Protein-tyrosine-phosphatase [Aphelenchoides besseyi]KAI6211051.1 Protein-tyrosine-phosphatase [Aphelenchoides besseyi]